MGFDKVRFRKPVVPGDQLILELEMLKMRSKVVKMAGVAKVDGQNRRRSSVDGRLWRLI
jgi:3-hydroxyacyl-[acyl-carrier-protein] dehydratase